METGARMLAKGYKNEKHTVKKKEKRLPLCLVSDSQGRNTFCIVLFLILILLLCFKLNNPGANKKMDYFNMGETCHCRCHMTIAPGLTLDLDV